jgi:hypothetical protein
VHELVERQPVIGQQPQPELLQHREDLTCPLVAAAGHFSLLSPSVSLYVCFSWKLPDIWA